MYAYILPEGKQNVLSNGWYHKKPTLISDYFCICTGLSLSRPRLSRITAYLEVKIWSLPKHENLTTGKKILLKNFSQYFQYMSIFKSPVTHIFVKCGFSSHFFLNSPNLICRSTDISKYFWESLGIRDNESRLYLEFSLRDNFGLIRTVYTKSKRIMHKNNIPHNIKTLLKSLVVVNRLDRDQTPCSDVGLHCLVKPVCQNKKVFFNAQVKVVLHLATFVLP